MSASTPAVPASRNPARQLAQVLDGATPLIWGGELTAALARRWASQIATHAKTPAFASQLPHMNHDEMMAFPGLPAELRALAKLVLLRDVRQQRQVQRRFDITGELVAEYVSGSMSVTADGHGPLARMLDLLVLVPCPVTLARSGRENPAGQGRSALRMVDPMRRVEDTASAEICSLPERGERCPTRH